MHEDVQRYLDGELTVQELPDALRAEATAWEALLEDVRMTAVSGAPAWLEPRVLKAVEIASRGRSG
jgi:flavin reductase (DIM6/NTAB) family NADH-FMN oxidoreductase RutF